MTNSPFPRTPDDLPRAWQCDGEPTQVWERFSPAYEAQAEKLWNEFAQRGMTPRLDHAGSEDGEAITATDTTGQTVFFLHLEDPNEAQEIAAALAAGNLDTLQL
ncbi:hypothetical protein KEM60_00455 [Austwickia sp. TVS 96-490-7B]|uniref:hypothetical protein n=1 Tax=Austwickia sp. TVS 96-490-7B TaxID=2830843 RepID=UPI001C573AE9|nr:hypothetical protein [Austwickia sp. TVS 96-490-7B]MBW3084268.1 hypothetical protein [Austwickia sp. TVS 96-490-7B]